MRPLDPPEPAAPPPVSCSPEVIALIRSRYLLAAGHAEEHLQNRWANPVSMRRRLVLAVQTVRWEGVRRWVDLGSGTGKIFDLATVPCPTRVAIDLSFPQLRECRRLRPTTLAVAANIAHLPLRTAAFDLVTCIGVVYCSGVGLSTLAAEACRILSPGGQCYLAGIDPAWVEQHGGQQLLQPGLVHYGSHEVGAAMCRSGCTVSDTGSYTAASSAERLPPGLGKEWFLLLQRRADTPTTAAP